MFQLCDCRCVCKRLFVTFNDFTNHRRAECTVVQTIQPQGVNNVRPPPTPKSKVGVGTADADGAKNDGDAFAVSPDLEGSRSAQQPLVYKVPTSNMKPLSQSTLSPPNMSASPSSPGVNSSKSSSVSRSSSSEAHSTNASSAGSSDNFSSHSRSRSPMANSTAASPANLQFQKRREAMLVRGRSRSNSNPLPTIHSPSLTSRGPMRSRELEDDTYSIAPNMSLARSEMGAENVFGGRRSFGRSVTSAQKYSRMDDSPSESPLHGPRPKFMKRFTLHPSLLSRNRPTAGGSDREESAESRLLDHSPNASEYDQRSVASGPHHSHSRSYGSFATHHRLSTSSVHGYDTPRGPQILSQSSHVSTHPDQHSPNVYTPRRGPMPERRVNSSRQPNLPMSTYSDTMTEDNTAFETVSSRLPGAHQTSGRRRSFILTADASPDFQPGSMPHHPDRLDTHSHSHAMTSHRHGHRVHSERGHPDHLGVDDHPEHIDRHTAYSDRDSSVGGESVAPSVHSHHSHGSGGTRGVDFDAQSHHTSTSDDLVSPRHAQSADMSRNGARHHQFDFDDRGQMRHVSFTQPRGSGHTHRRSSQTHSNRSRGRDLSDREILEHLRDMYRTYSRDEISPAMVADSLRSRRRMQQDAYVSERQLKSERSRLEPPHAMSHSQRIEDSIDVMSPTSTHSGGAMPFAMSPEAPRPKQPQRAYATPTHRGDDAPSDAYIDAPSMAPYRDAAYEQVAAPSGIAPRLHDGGVEIEGRPAGALAYVSLFCLCHC